MPQTRSDRLNNLPKYLFAELDEKKREVASKGVDIIDFGIGDPDIPPPSKMVEALKEALKKPEFHRYPSHEGADFFREAIRDYLSSTHGIDLCPESEIVVLIGSKEGIANLPQAILNPGDTALVADPCYPVHYQSVILAGATPKFIDLSEENGFLPDLEKIPESLWKEAKSITLNYPNNPTSAVATKSFFEKLIALAKKYNFVICHDAAYIDLSLDGKKQPTVTSLPGGKDVAIEFFSISKMFNATGWRLGFAVGNRDIVSSLLKYKTAIDSGQFTALQWAATVGLNECKDDIKKTLMVYKKRRDILTKGLKEMGLNYFDSDATFYVWTQVPKDYNSQTFSNMLLTKLGIVSTPGVGFGKMGDKYIRFSLTSSTERIEEATERMKKGI